MMWQGNQGQGDPAGDEGGGVVLLEGKAKHPPAPAGVLHRFLFPGDPVPYLVVPEIAKHLGMNLKVRLFSHFFFFSF